MPAALKCPHGMPSAASCVDCMDEGPVAAPTTWDRIGEPFKSLYASTCVGVDCGRPIVAGSRIQRFDRSDGSRTIYVHEGCVP